MLDNEGQKGRSFLLKRPIRAAIIVFVVLSVLATIFAIATGNTRSRFIRFIGLGIACSAFLAFVIIGTTLAARRLRMLAFLWCAVILCLLFGLLYVCVIFPRLMMEDHRQLMAFAKFFLRVAVAFFILITAAAVYGWVRFAWRKSSQ